MSTTVFTDFLNSVSTAVNSFLISGYDSVRGAVQTPLRLCLSIFVAVYGVLMLTGHAELTFRQAMGRLAVTIAAIAYLRSSMPSPVTAEIL